jgi:hypothetical protein
MEEHIPTSEVCLIDHVCSADSVASYAVIVMAKDLAVVMPRVGGGPRGHFKYINQVIKNNRSINDYGSGSRSEGESRVPRVV